MVTEGAGVPELSRGMSAGEETTVGALVKQNTAFHALKMSVVHSDASSSSLARLHFNVKKENEEQIQLMFTRHRMSAERGTGPFSTGAASLTLPTQRLGRA